jgi:hypothetical protein
MSPRMKTRPIANHVSVPQLRTLSSTGPGRNGRSQNGNRQSRTSFVQLWPGWGDLVNVGAIDRIYVYSTDGVARNYAYQVPLLDDSVLGFEAFGAVFGFVKSVYEAARSLPTFVGLAQMLGITSAPVGSKARRSSIIVENRQVPAPTSNRSFGLAAQAVDLAWPQERAAGAAWGKVINAG